MGEVGLPLTEIQERRQSFSEVEDSFQHVLLAYVFLAVSVPCYCYKEAGSSSFSIFNLHVGQPDSGTNQGQ